MSPVILIILPILAAFLLMVITRHSGMLGRLLGPAALAANLGFGYGLWSDVQTRGPWVEAIGGFAAPLGIVLQADGLGLLLVLAANLLGLLLWPTGERNRVPSEALTLLLIAGGSGLALSADLFNLYVFYELVAVASYGLAANRGDGPALAAALRYLVLSAAGSALALLGIALVYSLTGTLNLAQLAQLAPQTLEGPLGLSAFALMLIGFGVKAELFPVNTWVPEVYAAASVRVTALLTGLISKLALLVILRILVLIFTDPAAQLLLLSLGMITLVSGELAAYRARDLRRTLAYSSIGQLGLIAIAFAIGGPAGILAGIALALHHLVAKPALFLLAENWGGALHKLTGAARTSPLAAGLFVLLALSLIGVPPLPGFWAKLLLLKALLGTGTTLHGFAALLVLVMTIVKTAYLVAILRRLYQADRPQVSAPAMGELLPATALGIILLAGTLFTAVIGNSLTATAAQAADRSAYIARILPTAGGSR